MKKRLSILLCLALLTGTLSACGEQKPPVENPSKPSEPSKASSAESGQPSSEIALQPITFDITSTGTGENWELKGTPIGDRFYEKTGVNINMQYTIGDENQAVALMIASGDLPDVVMCRDDVTAFVDAEAALELTDLIEQNAPIYKEKLGDLWDRMKWSPENPGRYYISQVSQIQERIDTHDWFFLQHAVVKELNYPKIETLEDYENAIRSYMEKYPTIDGQPTIGLTMNCDQWKWVLGLTNPAMMAAGTQSQGEFFVDPQTHKVTYRVLRGEEKEYFRWLNKMYNEGILDKEAFTQTEDQFKSKVATGRVLAATGMGWQIQPSESTLIQDGKPERTYGVYPVALREGIVNANFAGEQALETPSQTIVVTTNCKDPARFMNFLNFVESDEGVLLNNWGLEGVHYDVIDGKRIFKPEEAQKKISDPDYSKKTGMGRLSGLCTYRDGVKDATGQYCTPSSKEDAIKKYTDVEKEVLAAYGWDTWASPFLQPEDIPVRPWPKESGMQQTLPADSDGAIAFQRCQDATKKGIINAIVGKTDEFDAKWAAFEKDMKDAGVEVYESQMEELIRQQMEMWGLDF